jgi:surface antigen
MSIIIGGCSNTDSGGNTNTIGGVALGAIGGGLIGGVVGQGNPGAIAAGAVAGGVLGGLIGHELDVRDRERRQAALNASLAAKESTRQTNWTNPQTGNSGSITPVSSYTDPKTGYPCREYNETYVREGHTYTQRSTACRTASGDWVASG